MLLDAVSGVFLNEDDLGERSLYATVKNFNLQTIEKMKKDTFFQVDHYGVVSFLEH